MTSQDVQKGQKGKTRRVGPYRLEEPLGAGGMGMVWRAWDERLKRPVAIKQILAEALHNPKIRERFRQEATAGARLNHPAIVHIYDLVENEDGDWMVMELVLGRTLRSLLEERPLPLARALRLGQEIAGGLAEAHAHGIVHRDLKTGNIMVTEAGRAKILDFGLAKLVHPEEGGDPMISQPGMILGTPYAMSPEQVLGQPVDHRSDLFSFGALLYEMVTGTAPFRGASIPVTVSRICGLRQAPVRELQPAAPPELSDLIDQLLQKDPQQRPQETREVAAALESLAFRLGREASGATGARSSLLAGSAEDALGVTVAEGPRPPGSRSWTEPTALAVELLLGTNEKRQVSVVCCGLVEIQDSSGELSSPGLENLSEAMPELRSLAQEVATRFEGYLGTTLGHLLWIYFGYPTAHGDDAQRAVRAARELVARVGRAGWAQGRSFRLALRAGVHSGPAIVSKDPRQSEHLALGPTLDLATGLQSLAPAHGVLASEATQRMIVKSFATEALPSVQLPGFAGPVAAWQVSAPLEAFDKTPIALTPLVGREREIDLVLQRWQMTQAGEGQALLVGGEAGIGKSRLLRTFRERLTDRGPWWLACYGSAYAGSSPFFPVIDLLQRQWLQPAASPEEELAHLEDLLRRHDLPVAETLPLFAALLSLPLPEHLPPLALSPEAQRKKTLEALVQLFLQAAENQPGVLVVEDLHWLDPSTLAWIGELLEALGRTPLLLILTFRLEFQIPWPYRSHWTQLSLGRLTDTEAEELISRIDRFGGGRARRLPPDVRRQIIAKADGIPLFVEELTKSAVESDDSGIIGIPSLLRDSLTARLDRLGQAKEVAQLAAVIGRVFSFELISAVSPFDPATLQRELDRLVQAELVYRKGVGARSQYLFKHALIQDAARELLLARDLQRLHQRVAEALEERFPEIAAAQPELLAHHYTQARQLDQASACWMRAGQSALRRFANIEGIKHLQEGLACLRALPPSAERDRRELEIQLALGPALVMDRGHSQAEVKATFDRVLELGRNAGEVPKEIQLLLWGFYNTRGEIRTSRTLALQMVQAGEARSGSGQDLGFLVYAVQAVASSHFYAGDLTTALRAHERVLQLYPADLEHPLLDWMGWDPRILALCELGQNLWFHGLPDQGLERSNEALDFARKLGHPPSLAIAYLLLAFLHHFRREEAAAHRYAQSLYDHCQEQGFHFFQAHSSFFLGLTGAALAATPDEADEQIRQALDGLATIRKVHEQELHAPMFLSWIAEVLIDRGRPAEAEPLLAEALESLDRRDERFWEPEVHRLQGVLQKSEDKLQRALSTARHAGSLALELRAVLDLARLWHGEGWSEEAARLLAGVEGRFTEGRETPDLQAACTLLDAIRSAS
ncbi:MAG TPA: protein kinase [Thermoanaerobaculia bacterium]|nr:protein kinase [Thermoanaerobaculia bacterium]